MVEEEWVKVATVDDTVVAELLLKLKQVKTSPPPPTTTTPGPTSKPALSLEWSVRQPRSKPVLVQSKKQAPRASPTTPLSWSGATSVSGGGASGSGGSFDGGPEEESGRASSSLKLSDVSRSKVVGTSEVTTSKKIRRKKTLAELKEEENLLEKERRQLKRELATLRHNLEREKAKNENFKRLKVDMRGVQAFEIHRTSESESSNQLLSEITSVHHVSAFLPPALSSSGGPLMDPPASTEVNKEEDTAGRFVLPDLNMLPDLNIPVEDNSSYDVLSGVS